MKLLLLAKILATREYVEIIADSTIWIHCRYLFARGLHLED